MSSIDQASESAPSASVDSGTVEVGRCYTRPRRMPLMIGRLPGMTGPLWGGPYSLGQAITGFVVLGVLWLTHPLWAHLGPAGNAVVMIAAPAAAMWAVRRTRVEGRSVFRALLGAATALAAPAGGQVRGRAWRPPRPRVCRPRRITITTTG